MTFIPESDVYRLIMRSKLPAAQRFERWVLEEILPTIRKHGMYATGDTLEAIVRDPQFGIRLLSELQVERENCKWRIQEKMRKGEVFGLRAMYGYTMVENRLVIQPELAEIVRQIFEWYVSGDSSVVIARRLNAAGQLTLCHAAWSAKHVRDILKNEKYAGNMLLQKTFFTDYLNKHKKKNHGELPKYFVTQTHEAIIDQTTFDTAQKMLADSYKKNLPSKPPYARYPLSGKIVCGNCGKHFQRKTTKERIVWLCAAYLEHGKSACPAKQIPEETILRAAADALGLECFDEYEFYRKIEHIEVTRPNRLRFNFFGGGATECEWKDRSRSESWTDEMKQAAREKGWERKKEQPCQQ